jgi:hypothetical protein
MEEHYVSLEVAIPKYGSLTFLQTYVLFWTYPFLFYMNKYKSHLSVG